MKKIKSFLKASHRLQEFVLRSLLFAARMTPKFAVGGFCSVVAFLAYPLGKKDRNKIERNIDKILGIPAGSEESEDFQNRVLKHQICNSIESLKASYNNDLITVAGFDDMQRRFQENLQKGKGLIIITAHMGSWEIAAYYCSLASDGKFSALAKPSKLEAATRLLDAYRLRMKTKTLWTDQRSLLKTMASTLKNGEALGFVMDQRPDGRKGPIVDFMGQPTQFVVGPAWASIRNGSPVVSVFCIRTGPWQYRMLCAELLPADHGKTDSVEITQIMASEIERIIRLHPEQWVWNYNRWQFEDQKE